MDPRCVAIHPSLAPLPLHPPSPHPCIQCALSTVTNPRVLYTLRRSACATLSSLADNFDSLRRLGVTFLSNLLHFLLNALFPLSSGDAELASDISSVCISTAIHFDQACDQRCQNVLSLLLFSECTAAIMLQDDDINCSLSIILLAKLWQVCFSRDIPLPSETLPTHFVQQLLKTCSLSTNIYEYVTFLLQFVLHVESSEQATDLMITAAASLPTHRNDDADKMFLTLASRVVELNPPCLRDCNVMIVVLRSSFMSSVTEIRALASRTILKLCDFRHHVEWLLDNSIFEYVVESLRVRNPTTQDLELLQYSAEALCALSHAERADRWVYSLDAVLSAASQMGPHMTKIMPALSSALLNAPVALFAEKIIHEVISVGMQLLSNGRDVCLFTNSLSDLLDRLRPSVASLNEIFVIVEGMAHIAAYAGHSLILLVQMSQNCSRLAQENRHRNDHSSQQLVRRLSFLTFEVWATTNKSFLVSLEEDDSTVIEQNLTNVMNLLTSTIELLSLPEQTWSACDLHLIISRCWDILPPRTVFALNATRNEISRCSDTIRKYCLRICRRENPKNVFQLADFPSSELHFLANLSIGENNGKSDAALELFRQSVSLDKVEALCNPSLLVESLTTRLSKISGPCEKGSGGFLEVMRLTMKVCSAFDLMFPIHEVSDFALHTSIKDDSFAFSCQADQSLFRLIVLEKGKSTAAIKAWESFADYYNTFLNADTAMAQILKSMLRIAGCFESIPFVIAEARRPGQLAKCVTRLIRRNEVNVEFVGRAIEKGGALHYLHQNLREQSLQKWCHDSEDQSCHTTYLTIKRSIGLLSLLSSVVSGLSQLSTRDITNTLCDLLTAGALAQNLSPSAVSLMNAVVECLAAIVLLSNDESAVKLILHSGVPRRTLEMLSRLSSGHRICDTLIPSICLFQKRLFRHLSENTFRQYRTRLTTALLQIQIRWDCLLSSFPFGNNFAVAHRVAWSCEFLKEVLPMIDAQKYFNSEAAEKITTALIIANYSSFTILQEAAAALLETLLQTQDAFAKCLSHMRLATEARSPGAQKSYAQTLPTYFPPKTGSIQKCEHHRSKRDSDADTAMAQQMNVRIADHGK